MRFISGTKIAVKIVEFNKGVTMKEFNSLLSFISFCIFLLLLFVSCGQEGIITSLNNEHSDKLIDSYSENTDTEQGIDDSFYDDSKEIRSQSNPNGVKNCSILFNNTLEYLRISNKKAEARDVYSRWRRSNTLLNDMLILDKSGKKARAFYNSIRTLVLNDKAKVTKNKVCSIINEATLGLDENELSGIAWLIVGEDGLKKSLGISMAVIDIQRLPINPSFLKHIEYEKSGKMKESAKKGTPQGSDMPGGSIIPEEAIVNPSHTERVIECVTGQNKGSAGINKGGIHGGGVTDPVIPSEQGSGKPNPTDKPNMGPSWPGKNGGYGGAFGSCFGLDPSKVGGFSGEESKEPPAAPEADWTFEVEDDMRGSIVKISGVNNEETNKVVVTTTWENPFIKNKIGYGKDPNVSSKTTDLASGYTQAEKKANDIKNKVENFYNSVKGGEIPAVSVKEYLPSPLDDITSACTTSASVFLDCLGGAGESNEPGCQEETFGPDDKPNLLKKCKDQLGVPTILERYIIDPSPLNLN